MTVPDGTPKPAGTGSVGEWRLGPHGWAWVDLDFTRPPSTPPESPLVVGDGYVLPRGYRGGLAPRFDFGKMDRPEHTGIVGYKIGPLGWPSAPPPVPQRVPQRVPSLWTAVVGWLVGIAVMVGGCWWAIVAGLVAQLPGVGEPGDSAGTIIAGIWMAVSAGAGVTVWLLLEWVAEWRFRRKHRPPTS